MKFTAVLRSVAPTLPLHLDIPQSDGSLGTPCTSCSKALQPAALPFSFPARFQPRYPPFSSSPNPPAPCRGAQGDPATGARQGGACTRGAPSAHERPGDGQRAAARARSSWRQHLAGGAGAGRVAWLPAGVWFAVVWLGSVVWCGSSRCSAGSGQGQ